MDDIPSAITSFQVGVYLMQDFAFEDIAGIGKTLYMPWTMMLGHPEGLIIISDM